jgi:uncharacterized membrane protein YqaE (UPF0057 family)
MKWRIISLALMLPMLTAIGFMSWRFLVVIGVLCWLLGLIYASVRAVQEYNSRPKK